MLRAFRISRRREFSSAALTERLHGSPAGEDGAVGNYLGLAVVLKPIPFGIRLGQKVHFILERDTAFSLGPLSCL